jgi:chromatin remodeling complex protein RSC6
MVTHSDGAYTCSLESDGDGKQWFLIFRQRQAGVGDESSNRADNNKNVWQRQRRLAAAAAEEEEEKEEEKKKEEKNKKKTRYNSDASGRQFLLSFIFKK